jgi:hypothetical protein
MVKKIKFRAHTKETDLVGLQPVPAVKTLPEWYRKMPLTFDKSNKLKVLPNGINATVKACVPFLDALSVGYMAVLDDDVQVEQLENGYPFFSWRTDRTIIASHSENQTDYLKIPDKYSSQAFKFEHDFIIELPKGYSLLITHPANRFDLPFYTLSGLVDSDNYSLPIRFPFLIEKGFEGIIERGTPIAQIIPIKRDNWESEKEPFDKDKSFIDHQTYFGKIIRSYKKNHWIKKTYQ